ncbi:MAG: 23S rRNA (guanosine(2251)-2'-O)-methyltransferase RlmB [bacterium]
MITAADKKTRTGRRGRGKKEERSPPAGGLYGLNPVEAALAAARRKLVSLAIKDGGLSPRLRKVWELAQGRGIPVEFLPSRELEARCGSPNHQGVVLRCGALPMAGSDAALNIDPGGDALLVALDQVEDPRNLGAVVRSAAAFGASGLVLHRDRSAPLSAAASNASAGALETFPVFQAPNLARFLAQARKRGFWVCGAVAGDYAPGNYAPGNSVAGNYAAGNSVAGDPEVTPLPAFALDGARVLVLGSEGRGLRPLVRSHCDVLLTIPLPGGGAMNSLNVSAAAAVLLYEMTRK